MSSSRKYTRSASVSPKRKSSKRSVSPKRKSLSPRARSVNSSPRVSSLSLPEDFMDDENNVNIHLAKLLDEIASYYRLDSDPKATFKARNFANAAARIYQSKEEIISGAQARENIPYIGEGIEYDIDEYLKTGKISRLEDLRRTYRSAKLSLDEFMKIHGIGPVKAVELYKQGHMHLEDLLNEPSLTLDQQTAIIWHRHTDLRIPREEMKRIERFLQNLFIDRVFMIVAGSFRRGMASSGDIDLVVAPIKKASLTNTMKLVLNSLRAQKVLVADLAVGPTKYNGIIRMNEQSIAHRLDIRVVPLHSWFYALLYFTGSRNFNIFMRKRAKELGLILNEYGLGKSSNVIKLGKGLPANSEQDIFNHLGVKYIPPEGRN